MSKLSRKAINFDLDTNEMKELGIYPDGYRQLGASLQKQGFTHRQGSGYTSKDRLSNRQVDTIIKKVTQDNPWLVECVKRMDVTDIGRQYDLTAVVKRFGKAQSRQDAKGSQKKLSTEDEAVISHIRASKLGSEFSKLYVGSDKYPGADKKLAEIIHFFSNGNEAQSERIFKSSALYKAENGDNYVKDLFADVSKGISSTRHSLLNSGSERPKNKGNVR